MTRSLAEDVFFREHPDPIWIVDLDTLEFLDANDAACEVYGWTRDEFLSLTLRDIRPLEDIPAMADVVASARHGTEDIGIWRHRTRDGRDLHVHLRGRAIPFGSRRARIVIARNVTAQVLAEEDSQRRDALELALRQSAEDAERRVRAFSDGTTASPMVPEAQLRYLDTMYRNAQRLIGFGAWEFHLESNELRWSDTTYAIFGVSPATFTPSFEAFSACVHPEDRERLFAIQARVIHENVHMDEVHRIVRPDGSVGVVREVAQVTDTPHGRVFAGVVLDLTAEERRAERERWAHDLMRIVGRTARIGGWRVSAAPHWRVEWTEETAWLHEVDDETSASPEFAFSFYDEPTRAHLQQDFLRCLEHGHPFDRVGTLRTARGRHLTVRVMGAPQWGVDGTVQAVHGALQDISELAAAQASADALAERLRETLEQISDGFLLLDEAWRVTFVNGVTETISGLARSAIEGRSLWQVFPEALGTNVETELLAIMGTGVSSRFVAHAPHPGRTLEVTGFRVQGGLALTLRDVTEQRKMAERIERAQKLETLGQLTGGIAHDFNNLLTVILGSADLLGEHVPAGTSDQQLAKVISDAALRGAELTSQLLSFARRQSLDPIVLDVHRAIASVRSFVARTLPESIETRVVRGDGLWLVEIDPTQLETALLNLALNARDAMPDGGELTFDARNVRIGLTEGAQDPELPAGEYVVLSVSDNGAGMDAATRARLFEPFFTTKTMDRGTGLGLPMVYGFVLQSGGHVRVDSEVGRGTTVHLYLPRAHGLAEPPPEPLPLDEAVGGTEHILVVEDHPLVQEHVASLLTGLGYRVTRASSGPEALERLGTLGHVDLLLSDVVMPGGLTGPQLAAEARRTRPSLRVLFSSGYTEDALAPEDPSSGGVHLLSKPYRRAELAIKVRTALDES